MQQKWYVKTWLGLLKCYYSRHLLLMWETTGKPIPLVSFFMVAWIRRCIVLYNFFRRILLQGTLNYCCVVIPKAKQHETKYDYNFFHIWNLLFAMLFGNFTFKFSSANEKVPQQFVWQYINKFEQYHCILQRLDTTRLSWEASTRMDLWRIDGNTWR